MNYETNWVTNFVLFKLLHFNRQVQCISHSFPSFPLPSPRTNEKFTNMSPLRCKKVFKFLRFELTARTTYLKVEIRTKEACLRSRQCKTTNFLWLANRVSPSQCEFHEPWSRTRAHPSPQRTADAHKPPFYDCDANKNSRTPRSPKKLPANGESRIFTRILEQL